MNSENNSESDHSEGDYESDGQEEVEHEPDLVEDANFDLNNIQAELNNIEPDLALQEQLLAISAEEDRIQLVLQDILTDLTTPENSDEDEDLPEIESRSILTNNISPLFERMKAADIVPNEDAVYSSLYEEEAYSRKARRKLRKMRKSLRDCHLNIVVCDGRFQTEVNRVRNLYPDLGGRVGLDLLVALHLYSLDRQEEGAVEFG